MRKNSGILSIAVIVFFSVISIIAFIYWRLSSQDLFTIFREGEKIVAINLAKSGAVYAENLIYNSYYKGKWPIILPSINMRKIKKEFPSGYFEIEYIKPLKKIKFNDRVMEKLYLNLPYYNKYSEMSGMYDIYKIIVKGVSKKSKTPVSFTLYLKTICMEEKQNEY